MIRQTARRASQLRQLPAVASTLLVATARCVPRRSHPISKAFMPPTATRSVRWQPYHSVPNSPAQYPHAKPALPPSPALSTPAPPHAAELRKVISLPHDVAYKNKYALSLVDQTVQTLCDIWHPSDIPPIFSFQRGSGGTAVAEYAASLESAHPVMDALAQVHATCLHNQLPSPITPTTSPFLTCPSISSSSPTSASGIRSAAVQANLVPIKGFVHEVLKRSRTSCIVLKTALCYIEAIREKVNDLVLQDKEDRQDFETTTPSSDHAISYTSVNRQGEANDVNSDSDRVSLSTSHSCNGLVSPSADDPLFATLSEPTGANAAAPDLPSPLLCPRRAFLASLIVASKFTMDKCYSNRAWAKLAGLPAREIGRCERALTQALDWHLWVGHHSTSNVETSQAQQPVVSRGRMLVKSQSEPALPLPAAAPFSTSWASAESIMTENAPEMIHVGEIDASTVANGTADGSVECVDPWLQLSHWSQYGKPDLASSLTPLDSEDLTLTKFWSPFSLVSISPRSTPGLTSSPTSTDSSSDSDDMDFFTSPLSQGLSSIPFDATAPKSVESMPGHGEWQLDQSMHSHAISSVDIGPIRTIKSLNTKEPDIRCHLDDKNARPLSTRSSLSRLRRSTTWADLKEKGDSDPFLRPEFQGVSSMLHAVDERDGDISGMKPKSLREVHRERYRRLKSAIQRPWTARHLREGRQRLARVPADAKLAQFCVPPIFYQASVDVGSQPIVQPMLAGSVMPQTGCFPMMHGSQ
ncbi:hypothetical protein FISHEDRAFT_77638 [Fistulina hepatica ATCC 64428]|uniref:Cyclin N-terminal domain-containing protein n=1 Tax=Fistulina hepatica ATCC 64428 TaxID=1128425 RepID=A0A0D7A0X1_9AGAR|nr:hypothetical protein FISHEDRAFT_77638 [Fistulina hepatica ATCC 64428]